MGGRDWEDKSWKEGREKCVVRRLIEMMGIDHNRDRMRSMKVIWKILNNRRWGSGFL